MRLFRVVDSSVNTVYGVYNDLHLPNPPVPRVPHGFGAWDYFVNNRLNYAVLDVGFVAWTHDERADVVAYYGPRNTLPGFWCHAAGSSVQVGDRFEITIQGAPDFALGPALLGTIYRDPNGGIVNTYFGIEILSITGSNILFEVTYINHTGVGNIPINGCLIYPASNCLGVVAPIKYNQAENEIAIIQNLACVLNEPITEIRRTDLPPGDVSELTGQEYDIVHVGGVITTRVANPGPITFTLTTNSDILRNVQIQCPRYEIDLNHLYTHKITNYSTCTAFNTIHTDTLRVRFRPIKRFNDAFEFRILSKYPNTYGPIGQQFCWSVRPQLSLSGNTLTLIYNDPTGTMPPLPPNARAFIFILQDEAVYTDSNWNALPFEASVLTKEMTLVSNTGTSATWQAFNYPSFLLSNFISPLIIGVITFIDSGYEIAIYSNPVAPAPADEFDDIGVYVREQCLRPLDSIVVAGFVNMTDRNLTVNDFDRDGLVRLTLQIAPQNTQSWTDVETYSAACTQIHPDTSTTGLPEPIYYGKYRNATYPSVSARIPLAGSITYQVFLMDPTRGVPNPFPGGTIHGVWPNKDVSNFFTYVLLPAAPFVPYVTCFVVTAHFRINRFLNPLNFYNLFSYSFNRVADTTYLLSIGPGFRARFKLEYISARNYFVGYTDPSRVIPFRDYQPYSGTVISNTQNTLIITPPAGFVPPSGDDNFIFSLHAGDITTNPITAVFYAHTPLAYANHLPTITPPGVLDNVPPTTTITQYNTPVLRYDPVLNQIIIDKSSLPAGTYYLYMVGTSYNERCPYNEIFEFGVTDRGEQPEVEMRGECCPHFYYVRGEVIDVISFDPNATNLGFTDGGDYYYVRDIPVEQLNNYCQELSDFCPVVLVDKIEDLYDVGLVEIKAVFNNRILAQGFQYVNLVELVRHKGFVRPANIVYEQIDYETITNRERRLVQKTFEYEFEVELIAQSSCEINNIYTLLHAQYWEVSNLRSDTRSGGFGLIKSVEIDSSEFPYAVKYKIILRGIKRANEARYPYPQ